MTVTPSLALGAAAVVRARRGLRRRRGSASPRCGGTSRLFAAGGRPAVALQLARLAVAVAVLTCSRVWARPRSRAAAGRPRRRATLLDAALSEARDDQSPLTTSNRCSTSARSRSPSRWSSPGRSSRCSRLLARWRRVACRLCRRKPRRRWKSSSRPSTARSATRCRPTRRRYRALIGTIFMFMLLSNWSSLIPGVEPPTAHIETDAALGAHRLLSRPSPLGFARAGSRGYLATFAEPTWVMIPLNVVEQFTRTFSLIVRLFGNVMSGVFVIGIVLSLAGPPGADPADGARSADRRDSGLHLRGARDRLHRRRRGERRRASADAAAARSNDHERLIQVVSIFAAAIAVSLRRDRAGARRRPGGRRRDGRDRPPAGGGGTMSRTLFVGLAMIETMAIYCLVIALLRAVRQSVHQIGRAAMRIDWWTLGAADGQRPRPVWMLSTFPVPAGRRDHRASGRRRPRSCSPTRRRQEQAVAARRGRPRRKRAACRGAATKRSAPRPRRTPRPRRRGCSPRPRGGRQAARRRARPRSRRDARAEEAAAVRSRGEARRRHRGKLLGRLPRRRARRRLHRRAGDRRSRRCRRRAARRSAREAQRPAHGGRAR